MNMGIPDYNDISPTGGVDLDERSVAKIFLGKTQKEAADLFFKNSCHYVDYLRYMGDKAFAYYFPSIIPYLESEESVEDAEIIIDIESIISIRMKYQIESIKLAIQEIIHSLDYIIINYDKFDPYPRSHKNLKKKIEILYDRLLILIIDSR